MLYFLENSNDPCRQPTTARTVECALWTVQNPSAFRALLQTKTAKCDYFSNLMLWKCCTIFFHSFENSCRKRKFTELFPHRSYTLHLSLFVNNRYKWTSQIPRSAILSLVQLQLYFYGKKKKGVSGRNPPKHTFSSFSLFKAKKRTPPFFLNLHCCIWSSYKHPHAKI